MKKSVKIITLALSLALVLGAAIGFSINAGASAPEVVAKNVLVDGNFCLMFAVDPATVAGETVTLKVYEVDPATEGATVKYTYEKAASATEKIDLDADGVKEFDALVFCTAGVSAKDIADTWYYTVESAGVVSEVDTYSVREYAFERLYGDNKIAAIDVYGARQRNFYLSILSVGSTAQDLLVNTKLEAEGKAPERLANEYSYASIIGGGADSQQFVEIGDSLTLPAKTAGNDPLWKVFTYGTNGALLGTKAVALGSTITIEGNTVVIPGWLEGLTPGKYFNDLGNAALNFDGVAFADTGIYTNMANKPAQNKYGNYKFVDVDGRGQVLSLNKDGVTEIGGGAIRVPVVDNANGNGNCLVAEFDIKFDGSMVYNNSEYNTDKFISTALNIIAGTEEARVDASYSWKAQGTASMQIASAGIYMIDDEAAKTGSNGVVGGTYYSPEKSTNNAAKYRLEGDTWYNVCIEWYDINDGKIYLKMYIDGTLFYSTYGNYTTLNTTSNPDEYDYNHINEAKTFKITLQDRYRPAEVCIDNLVVTLIEKDYVK